MYNHFRTLLLNLPYAGDETEHIPSTFKGIILPLELSNVYRLLFPDNTSRFYKQELAQSYMRLVTAAGLTPIISDMDNRTTYNLSSATYFKINRSSNPNIKDAATPIFIFGKYANLSSNAYYYDNFLITQVDASNVLVYSTVNNVYLKDTKTSQTATGMNITLSFTADGVSQVINIGSTGISFQIAGGTAFATAPYTRTWEFLVEAPYVFDFFTLYNRIKGGDAATKMFKWKPDVSVDDFKNLYDQHFNPVYQLAGLIASYVIKCNSLV